MKRNHLALLVLFLVLLTAAASAQAKTAIATSRRTAPLLPTPAPTPAPMTVFDYAVAPLTVPFAYREPPPAPTFPYVMPTYVAPPPAPTLTYVMPTYVAPPPAPTLTYVMPTYVAPSPAPTFPYVIPTYVASPPTAPLTAEVLPTESHDDETRYLDEISEFLETLKTSGPIGQEEGPALAVAPGKLGPLTFAYCIHDDVSADLKICPTITRKEDCKMKPGSVCAWSEEKNSCVSSSYDTCRKQLPYELDGFDNDRWIIGLTKYGTYVADGTLATRFAEKPYAKFNLIYTGHGPRYEDLVKIGVGAMNAIATNGVAVGKSAELLVRSYGCRSLERPADHVKPRSGFANLSAAAKTHLDDGRIQATLAGNQMHSYFEQLVFFLPTQTTVYLRYGRNDGPAVSYYACRHPYHPVRQWRERVCGKADMDAGLVAKCTGAAGILGEKCVKNPIWTETAIYMMEKE